MPTIFRGAPKVIPGTPTIILQLGRIGLFGLLASVGIGAEPTADAAATKAPPVVMESFAVEGNYVPKLCFGLSLNVWKDGNTRKITSLIIDRVRTGSEAEQQGLTAMTRILKLDGKPVQDIEASFFKGTELNRIFVDRRNGDKVTLEVWFPGAADATTIVLTEHRTSSSPLIGALERFER